MHVLILHMRYHPDPTGTGPLVTELARGFVEMGEDVSVIASAPHYGREKVPPRYRWRLAVQESDKGVELWRTLAFARWSSSLFGRGIDYALYTTMSAVLALRVSKPDAILAVAPPITVAVVAWIASRLRGAPLVYNAQDIWPDGLVAMERLRPGLVLGLLGRLERWVYSVADKIVVVGEGMRENLLGKGVPADKVAVIHNWVDTREIRPLESSQLRSELDLEDDFVVLFAGNIGFASGLETVLEAAKRIQHRDKIRFLLVGEGSAKGELVREAHRLELDNIVFLPTQPRERLNDLLNGADLCLVTLRSGMGGMSVPSKTYSYMAAGKAVLAAVPENSEVRRILGAAECGVWVPADAPEDMARAVEELSAQPQRLTEMGREGREYAEAHFSRLSAIEAYRSLLREVVKEGH